MNDIEFIKKYYTNQIDAYIGFIEDAYPSLPDNNSAMIRFGGGTALAIYYFQHRLSFDIDLFVIDSQIISYLSPKHWLEETKDFNTSSYIDLSNHIRVLYLKNNIKVDVLVSQDFVGKVLIDDSFELFPKTIYVESVEDIIAKKIIYRGMDNITRDIIDIAISIVHVDILTSLIKSEAISNQDIVKLYNALGKLDMKIFREELEIVNPFAKYRETAINAPEIIKKECLKYL